MKCFIVFYCVPIKNIIFECTKATIVKIEAFLITQDNVHILVGVSQKSLNYNILKSQFLTIAKLSSSRFPQKRFLTTTKGVLAT